MHRVENERHRRRRARIVEMMWEVVYFDGRATEFEENVMWRVCELLNVTTRERIELRGQVVQKGA